VIARVPGEVGHGSEQTPQSVSPGTQETETTSPANSLTAAAAVSHESTPEELNAERLLALISVLIAAAGIGAGWVIFKKRPTMELPRILQNKYYVDEIYDAALIHPIESASREGLWKIFDIGVIDGLLHSIGEAVVEAGRVGRYLQAGLLRGYAAIILFGALILIGVFAWFSIAALAR
jgi:NADH-quinone oxidoreductase subunit L